MRAPVTVIREFLGAIDASPGVPEKDIADRGLLLEYRLPHHGYARLAMSKGGRLAFLLHADGAGRPMTSVRFELRDRILAHVLRKFLLLGQDKDYAYGLTVALFTCSTFRAVQNCADVTMLHNEVARALALNFAPGSAYTCSARPMPSLRRMLNNESDLIWQDNFTVSERWSLTPDVDAAAARAESALQAWAAGAREAAATHVQARFRGWMARRTHAWNPATPLGRFYALRDFAELACTGCCCAPMIVHHS